MDPMNPIDGGSTGAHIGKSVTIKGELSGSESLFLDGEVEGSIHLQGHNLTVGQNGRVRASVKAKDVVVHGRIDGNVHATDRLDVRKTAIIMGDLQSQRLSIEDGAFLNGKIETTREARPEPKQEAKQDVKQQAAVTPSTPPVVAVSS